MWAWESLAWLSLQPCRCSMLKPRCSSRSLSARGVSTTSPSCCLLPAGGVNAAAVAPDGLHIAVACKDGVLRVYALPSGGLVAGFKVRAPASAGCVAASKACCKCRPPEPALLRHAPASPVQLWNPPATSIFPTELLRRPALLRLVARRALRGGGGRGRHGSHLWPGRCAAVCRLFCCFVWRDV